MLKQTTYWLKVITLGMILGLGLQFAQAWTNPGATAPGSNVSGPITTGGPQTKTGELTITGGGAYGTGGLTIGSHSLNSSGTWLYLGDQNHGVYGSRGLAAGYLYASDLFYSNNWSQFKSGNQGYALGVYDSSWGGNVAPRSTQGSITVNDIYLRSAGKWASEMGGAAISSCPAGKAIQSIAANGTVTCIDVSSGGSSTACASPSTTAQMLKYLTGATANLTRELCGMWVSGLASLTMTSDGRVQLSNGYTYMTVVPGDATCFADTTGVHTGGEILPWTSVPNQTSWCK